ncbi:MAG: hypothetical protein EOO43_18185 [Flavobacterium sp.]|nr:MAG: hypothetical protein EOO43_18185 [Flavobacterium sp.]
MKVDGNLSWNWLGTFCIMLFYLGFFSIYFILLCITLVYTIIKRNSPGSVYPGMDRNVQFIGVVWNFLTNGFSPILMIGLCGYLSGTYGDLEDSFMQNSLRAGQALSITCICFTVLYSNYLKKFLAYFYKDELRATARVSHAAIVGEKPIIYLEKAKTYLVMISSTYFVPLEEGFIPKDKTKVELMKKSIQRKKTNERTESPLLKNMNSLAAKMTNRLLKTIDDLKSEKTTLDRKLTNIISHREGKGVSKVANKDVISASMHDLELSNSHKKKDFEDKFNKTESEINKDLSDSKMFLSEGNNASLIVSKGLLEEEDENSGLCYICYTNEANANRSRWPGISNKINNIAGINVMQTKGVTCFRCD